MNLAVARHVVHIAENLTLDASLAAAQRFAFLGASGSGKSYGCGRYVEQLSAAHVPVIVVDTVGIWPALRLAADGKAKGLPFTIIGGEHADVPLDLDKGAELARFLIQHEGSAVIDLSDHEPTSERALFVTEFAHAALVAVKQTRRPRVIVFDEAQDLVPQVPGKGEESMVRAVSALVRKGRNHSCGTVLVTQRPQDVNKRAFDQVGNLFVGALFAKRARDAVRDWAGNKARSVEVDAQVDDLPSLQPGEFFFWSPQWLKVYQRIKVLPKWTYDGSATTLLAYSELAKLAPVDVKALRALLTPPVKPAPANGAGAIPLGSTGVDDALGGNWEELEQRVNELLDERNEARAAFADCRAKLEAALLSNGNLEKALVRISQGLVSLSEDAMHQVHDNARLEALPPALPDVSSPTSRNPVPQRTVGSRRAASPRENGASKGLPRESGQKAHSPDGTSGIAGGDYRGQILAAICRFGPIFRARIAIVTARNPTSSQFARVLRELVAGGLVVETDKGYQATPKGVTEGATPPRFLRGEKLRAHWRDQMGPYTCKIFDALWPTNGATKALARTELARAADVNETSSQYARQLRWLRRIGLVDLDVSGSRSLLTLSGDTVWAMVGR